MKTKKTADQRFMGFYESHKDKFPYNQVRCTRRSIYSKWLLVETRSDPGIRFYSGRLFAMLSKTMDKKMVQRMIVSRRALPLPDEFCSVMDSMYHWGRCISANWYRKTLELLKYYLLNGDDIQRGTNWKTFLHREVIRLRVLERLNNVLDAGAVLQAWSQHYKERVEFGETEFFMLAVSSIRFVNNEVTRLQVRSQYRPDSSMSVVSNVD
jgi:hypothetical protein